MRQVQIAVGDISPIPIRLRPALIVRTPQRRVPTALRMGLNVLTQRWPFGAISKYVALRSGPERTYALSSPAWSILLSVVVVLKPSWALA